jgi:AraC-like DNA-binding protein
MPPVKSSRSSKKSSEGFHHYLPIPDEILHSGIYVTSVGQVTIRPGEPYPKSQHPSLYHFTWNEGRTLPEFSLLLVARGRGVFESRETGRITLEQGEIILVIPGVWHRYRPDAKVGWTEKWVQFNGELPHKLLDHGIISPEQSVLRPAHSRFIEITLDRLLETVHRDPTSNSLSLSLQTLGALSLALRGSIAPAPRAASQRSLNVKQSDPVVAAAVDYIWTRSHKVLSVMDVVKALGVTRRKLERRMAAAMGHSVLEEIIQCRFSRAERLLRETELPIKTIVTLAGFGSMENMRQTFIARAKLSPATYRSHRRFNPHV